MNRYGVKKGSLFAFLEEHYPATFLSFYGVERGDEKSKVTFRVEAIRYYAQLDPANDFEKHGCNSCYVGRWSKEESEEFKYMAVHTEFFDVEMDNKVLNDLGLII